MNWFDYTDWQAWAILALSATLVLDVALGGFADRNQDRLIKLLHRTLTPTRPSRPGYKDNPVKWREFDEARTAMSSRVGHLEDLPTNKREGLDAWAERYIKEKTNPTVTYPVLDPDGFYQILSSTVPAELTPEKVEALKAALNRQGDPAPEQSDEV